MKIKKSELKEIIKESVKKVLKNQVLSEIKGWNAEPDDFCIVGGKIDPNKQYMLIKISMPNGIYAMFVTEYKEYFPDMINDIKEWTNDEEMFVPLDKYYEEVRQTMEEENCDEEYAEELVSEIYCPIFDYDFAVYAPYGISNSKPMSGAEMQRRIDQTGNLTEGFLKNVTQGAKSFFGNGDAGKKNSKNQDLRSQNGGLNLGKRMNAAKVNYQMTKEGSKINDVIQFLEDMVDKKQLTPETTIADLIGGKLNNNKYGRLHAMRDNRTSRASKAQNDIYR